MKNDGKNTKVKLDKEIEALVRKTLSDLEDSTQALSLWLNNSLKEWELQDPMIFGFQVRVKSIKKVVEKAKSLSEKGVVFRNANDVKNNINDIVGARILVFSHKKMISIHREIINHKRFDISKASLHYREENPSHFINDLMSEMSSKKNGESYSFNKEPNKTGYTDAHYWITPTLYDNCYTSKTEESIDLYDKFELQVRTVTQHAWSEMQHKMVYKSNCSKEEKERILLQFETLLDVVDSFDIRLSGILSQQKPLTISKNIQIKGDDSFSHQSKLIINSFENGDISAHDIKIQTMDLFDKYKKVLKKLDEKSLDYQLQICELALKGSMHG